MPKKQKKKKIKEKREKSNDSLQLRTRAPLSVRLFSVWHLLSVSIIFFLRLCFFYDSNRQSGNVTLFLFFFLFPYRSLFLSLSISLSVTLSLFHSFSVSDRSISWSFWLYFCVYDLYCHTRSVYGSFRSLFGSLLHNVHSCHRAFCSFYRPGLESIRRRRTSSISSFADNDFTGGLFRNFLGTGAKHIETICKRNVQKCAVDGEQNYQIDRGTSSRIDVEEVPFNQQ